MATTWWMWIAFGGVIAIMLALDLGVFHRKAHVVRFREAFAWTVAWILLAQLFMAFVYLTRGPTPAIEFLTAYLIEESLSVDNIFVFLLIFKYFNVSTRYQHKVLFWGIVGVMIMRGLFIALGITILERFHWMIYVFGGFLILTGIKLAFEKDKEIHPERNPVLRLFKKFVPVTHDFEGERFVVKHEGKWYATPLLLVLIVVETTDVIFAIDSVPAVLGVTSDPFIVYTSNIFAIMGLRSLYFAISGLMEMFHYLHYGLSAILVFVGVKMVLSGYTHIPTPVALSVIAGILFASVAASVIWASQTQDPRK